MKRMLGFFCAIMLLLGAFVLLPVHGESEIYDSVIRLHVLANSDSDKDQQLKLLVRDEVLHTTQLLLRDVQTRDEAAVVLRESLGEIRTVAQNTLKKQGCDDAVSVSLGQESYPTREYEQLAFPAGEYLSLRVMIGEAEGANWWCVLFPPLCLSAATTKAEAEEAFLAAGLTEEQYRIITDSNGGKYRLRFKILEVAGKIFN
ncbi:MAG: stage II sporulation protein R [Ruminococcaceae bacterium]|nr:stage II sporulation protein R [Oscillospiraceae bacterium]